MRYLSLFSGIEAATAAWHPLGWACVAVAEIEPFPSKVLAHHYPNVRNLGDVTKLTELDIADLGPIDVVVFGSPCQDLSVAGKRKGLAGARSGLFFTAMQIITWSRLWCGTRFALWENVPGAFSSNKGADFAAVVDELSGLAGTEPPPKGWGTEGCAAGPEAMVEWSTLDAQWFGVAQRRRRVFALADFGNWSGRQPILLEPQGLRGASAPSREAGQGFTHSLAPSLTASGRGVERTGDTRGQDPVVAHSLRGEGFDASEGGTGRGTPLGPVGVTIHGTDPTVQKVASYSELAQCLRARTPGNIDNSSTTVVQHPLSFAIQAGALRTNPASGPDGIGVQANHAYTLEARAEVQAVCFDTTQITSAANYSNPKAGDPCHPCHPLAAGAHAPAIAFDCKSSGQNGFGINVEVAGTQRAMGHSGSHSNGGGHQAVALPSIAVRRLTPVECERLMGFPDDHTLIPWRNKPADQCPDGPRYKSLGNSMAVPVMRWIGRRIDLALLFQE